MRRALLLAAALSLAACHGAPARGPAWPKSAGTVAPDDYKDDGGESLEPHPSHVAAIEVADDETPAASAAPAAAVPAAKGTTTTTTPAPAPTPTPIVETIEIQIEDIQVGPGDIIITP